MTTTIRVDPDVAEAIRERQSELQLDNERHVSMSAAVADLLEAPDAILDEEAAR